MVTIPIFSDLPQALTDLEHKLVTGKNILFQSDAKSYVVT